MIKKTSSKVVGFILSVFVLVAGFVVFMPFLFMFAQSMRLPSEAYRLPPDWFPTTFDLTNYKTLFASDLPMMTMVGNSALVTFSIIVLRLIVAILAAYAIAKIRYRGSNVVMVGFLSSMMLPIQATIIPLYIIMSNLGLVNTRMSLIIIGIFDSFCIFMLKQSMATIPDSIVESAKIDGAGHMRICWQIIVPMIKSSLATMVILIFNGTWNDYFLPYIFISSWDKMTLPLGINALKGYMGSGNQSVILAAVSFAVTPILIIFLFGQRYIVEGLTASAIKG